MRAPKKHVSFSVEKTVQDVIRNIRLRNIRMRIILNQEWEQLDWEIWVCHYKNITF